MIGGNCAETQRWWNIVAAAPLRIIIDWYRVSQERALLREMTTERLTDIGLSRQDVEAEIQRPFWQVRRKS